MGIRIGSFGDIIAELFGLNSPFLALGSTLEQSANLPKLI